MSQFARWLTMGGYAMYIWSAYALVFVILGASIPAIKRQRRKIRKQMQSWFAGPMP